MSEHPLLELREVSVVCDGAAILDRISLCVNEAQRWAVIGPNGAGKSTLLRAAAGLQSVGGDILLYGRPLNRYSARARAVALAYMPQKPEGVIPFTVHDFVMLGRYAHMGVLGMASPQDYRCSREAMAVCDVADLSQRLMSTLSGGELQRVLLAGAVAQESALMLLDEPTTFLDPAHERLFGEAFARLHATRTLTSVTVTHDINNALLQSTHVLALRNGSVLFSGSVDAFRCRCPQILQQLFGVCFEVFTGNRDNVEIFGAWGGVCAH